MSANAASATSIRRRLLLFLLPPLILLMLVGVYINYHTATLFVRAANDQKLADIARALGTQIRLSADPVHPGRASLSAPAGILFSITASNGKIVAGDSRLSAVPHGSAALSYGDTRFDGRDLRLATYRVAMVAGVTAITVAD